MLRATGPRAVNRLNTVYQQSYVIVFLIVSKVTQDHGDSAGSPEDKVPPDIRAKRGSVDLRVNQVRQDFRVSKDLKAALGLPSL